MMKTSREIDPMAIIPWDLPSVSFEERTSLPESQGIYFCLRKRQCLYIGKTENQGGFRARWKDHHRIEDLNRFDEVRIAYWEMPTAFNLIDIESELIDLYNPEFNGKSVYKSLKQCIAEQFAARLENRSKQIEACQFRAATSEALHSLWRLEESLIYLHEYSKKVFLSLQQTGVSVDWKSSETFKLKNEKLLNSFMMLTETLQEIMNIPL